jgi:hypothetical protein
MVSFIWLICWLWNSIFWSNLCRSSTNSFRLASNRNLEANKTSQVAIRPALIRLFFGASLADAPSLVHAPSLVDRLSFGASLVAISVFLV